MEKTYVTSEADATVHICPVPQLDGPLTIQDLPDEALVLILKNLPLHFAITTAELVCKAWLRVLRGPDLLHTLDLASETVWCGHVNERLLQALVNRSLGSRLLGGPGGWPRPSGIRRVELSGCVLRRASPTRCLQLLMNECPRLEEIRAIGICGGGIPSHWHFVLDDLSHLYQKVVRKGRPVVHLDVAAWSPRGHNYDRSELRGYTEQRWRELLDALAPESPIKVHELLCPTGPWSVLTPLGDPVRHLQSLQQLADALAASTTLRSLSFGEMCTVGDEGARLLGAALQANSSLTSLSLRKNGVGDRGTSFLAAALEANTTLVELHLAANQVGDRGALALARALEHNRSLRHLMLSRNDIGDEGALALGSAWESTPSLEVLDITKNKFPERSAEGSLLGEAVVGLSLECWYRAREA